VERLERLELAAASHGDVPNITSEKMSVGSRHRFPWARDFWPKSSL
jgi:hypothetical protein